MKKLLLLILGLFLSATPAFSVVDPDRNSMGIYFDLNADFYEMSVSPFTLCPVYVILTRPDFDTVYGYEFGYEIRGNCMVARIDRAGADPIDLGYVPGNHIVSLAEPLETTEATILCTLTVMPLDNYSIDFTLLGATPNSVEGSNLPAVLLADGVVLSTGVSVWDPSNEQPAVCAFINYPYHIGPISVVPASWDGVKSLYR